MSADYRYPVPTESIFDDVDQYVPILLAAIDDYMDYPNVWPEGEEEAALGYMEDVKAWIQELSNTMFTPIGAVIMYVGYDVPEGWLVCNGDTYLKSEYPELYQVLGSNFDKPQGEPTDFFSTPNLSERSPFGHGVAPYDVIGQGFGALTHTLTTAEMPVHDHSTQPHRHQVHKRDNPGGFSIYLPASSNSDVANNAAWTEMATVDVDPSGGGGAHNNLHPVTVVNFIVRAK